MYKCLFDKKIEEEHVLGYFPNYDKAKDYAIKFHNLDPTNGDSEIEVCVDKIKLEESKLDSFHNEIEIRKIIRLKYSDGKEDIQDETMRIFPICELGDKEPHIEIQEILIG